MILDTSSPSPPMSFKWMVVALLLSIVGVVYFVFLPQLSKMNAIQQNNCHYLNHSLEPCERDNIRANPCFNCTVHVMYEHSHEYHDHYQMDHPKLSEPGEPHVHHGVVHYQGESKEKLDTFINNLKKEKQFICYVDILNPVHKVYIERPSSIHLLIPTTILLILGSLAALLLQDYATWFNAQKQRSSQIQKGQELQSIPEMPLDKFSKME
jgi:hypothetical protein